MGCNYLFIYITTTDTKKTAGQTNKTHKVDIKIVLPHNFISGMSPARHWQQENSRDLAVICKEHWSFFGACLVASLENDLQGHQALPLVARANDVGKLLVVFLATLLAGTRGIHRGS